MAARRLRRADGKEFARPPGSTLAADARPSAGNARGDPTLLSAGRPRPMAPTDPDRCEPPGHWGSYAGGLYGLALFGLISAFVSAFFLHIPNPAASVPAL